MVVLVLLTMSCVWLGVRGGTCPSLYLRYSEHHTYCLPANSTCKIEKNGVKDDDKEVILREHNAYRSKVATGKESTYSLPAASNMLQMVWDDELASVAQKHADQCVFEHDCKECRRVKNFGVGQNLFTRRTQTAPSKPDWAATVKDWYDEVKYFQKKQIDSFKDGTGPPATGHFTQVIWATTWRIGCGYTLFKEGSEFVELYTCDYGPSGNTKDRSIYEKGNPCNGCPVNSCCGNSCSKQSYPGLCQISGDNAPQYNPPED
uniref:U26-Hexatoxin-Hf1c_1 n=1 Tax=Hadronyche formidabilis TaxID=426499 RepID=A0A4V2H9H4_HADFO